MLTLASLVGALGNYAFQGLMGRMLPLSEFGYLNAALGLGGILTVAVVAASQAVTHHLARHHARDEQQHIEELKAASSAFLFYLTILCSVLAVAFIHPLTVFFNAPRSGIALWVLGTILVNLWWGLAYSWCAGLGRFYFLAGLMVATVAVRLLAGWIGTNSWSVAEAGIAASVFSGMVLVVGVVLRERTQLRWGGNMKPLWEPEFVRFLVASLAVAAGSYAFTSSDAIVAQRHLAGSDLGAYTAAGLFGRAVVWLPLPILTVFFTTRSGQERSDAKTRGQLLAFVVLLLLGAAVVILAKGFLCRLLLGRADAAVMDLMGRFVAAMIPAGLLQALGFYTLAARRFAPAITYGVCALLYGAALIWFGRDAQMLLTVILTGASATVAAVGAVALVCRRND